MKRACTDCGGTKFLPIMKMIPFQEIHNPMSLIRPDGVECHGCGKHYDVDEEGCFSGLVDQDKKISPDKIVQSQAPKKRGRPPAQRASA